MTEILQKFSVPVQYRVIFTRDAFAPDSPVLADVLQRAGAVRHRLLPVIDSGVLQAWPELPARIQQYAHQHAELFELVGEALVVRGGEICKNEPLEVTAVHEQVEQHALCRHSWLLIVGGGAVLDAIGYAAATAHRGIRTIRMPTTVLSQNDSGVGVKNAINFHQRKNFLGTFAAPYAVINDVDFIQTLAERDKRAGIAEAVKVALIRDAQFFLDMEGAVAGLAAFETGAMQYMIEQCARLHIQHIGQAGDPFESGTARPLDFGHWSAHRLEELSANRLRHGEAVAIGIALDVLYGELIGDLRPQLRQRVFALLEGLGFELRSEFLCQLDVESAIEAFREHLGGELTITLLRDLGEAYETHHIDLVRMQQAVDTLKPLADAQTAQG